MRNGQLDNEEKARAVLCRTGRPGNECACLDENELAELAAIYDECVAPEQNLKQRMAGFWGRRHERMAAAKAVDQLEEHHFTRNRAAKPAVNPPPPAGEV